MQGGKLKLYTAIKLRITSLAKCHHLFCAVIKCEVSYVTRVLWYKDIP